MIGWKLLNGAEHDIKNDPDWDLENADIKRIIRI